MQTGVRGNMGKQLKYSFQLCFAFVGLCSALMETWEVQTKFWSKNLKKKNAWDTQSLEDNFKISGEWLYGLIP
jgi:hypothetical protein